MDGYGAIRQSLGPLHCSLPESGLRLALPSSTPSCTFPAEGKFSAWPGLPVAPEFLVFEEAAGREKGAVYSRASSGKAEASPLCLSRCKMHPSCASGGEPGAPEGGGLQTPEENQGHQAGFCPSQSLPPGLPYSQLADSRLSFTAPAHSSSGVPPLLVCYSPPTGKSSLP